MGTEIDSSAGSEGKPDRAQSAWEKAASLARSGDGSNDATMVTFGLLAIADAIGKLAPFQKHEAAEKSPPVFTR